MWHTGSSVAVCGIFFIWGMQNFHRGMWDLLTYSMQGLFSCNMQDLQLWHVASLVVACRIFLVVVCRIFSCGMWDLYLWHVGPLVVAYYLTVACGV